MSDLRLISFLSNELVHKLANMKIRDVSTLLAQTSTPQGRASVARFADTNGPELIWLAKRLELLTIPGVDIKALEGLTELGVGSVELLAEQPAAELHARINTWIAMRSPRHGPYPLMYVQQWIDSARRRGSTIA